MRREQGHEAREGTCGRKEEKGRGRKHEAREGTYGGGGNMRRRRAGGDRWKEASATRESKHKEGHERGEMRKGT